MKKEVIYYIVIPIVAALLAVAGTLWAVYKPSDVEPLDYRFTTSPNVIKPFEGIATVKVNESSVSSAGTFELEIYNHTDTKNLEELKLDVIFTTTEDRTAKLLGMDYWDINGTKERVSRPATEETDKQFRYSFLITNFNRADKPAMTAKFAFANIELVTARIEPKDIGGLEPHELEPKDEEEFADVKTVLIKIAIAFALVLVFAFFYLRRSIRKVQTIIKVEDVNREQRLHDLFYEALKAAEPPLKKKP